MFSTLKVTAFSLVVASFVSCAAKGGDPCKGTSASSCGGDLICAPINGLTICATAPTLPADPCKYTCVHTCQPGNCPESCGCTHGVCVNDAGTVDGC